MRSVFDTVVFVRGLINPYSPCGRLVFDHSGDYDLVVSPTVAAEYLDVFNRPEVTAKFRPETDRDLSTVWGIIAKATIVEPSDTPAICRDPEDDKFLAAAVTGAAQFIVSEDLDLLAMGDYAGIPILNAMNVLRMLTPPGNARE